MNETRSIIVQADELECIDEADGWGSAEPYLWTIFISFDGTTIRQDPDDSSRLVGAPQFQFGNGSHRNLGSGSVTDGDIIDVPSPVGFFGATVEPIPISFLGQDFELPPAVGIISVLMEEDNVSDSGAEAGHQALNDLVQDRVTAFAAALDLNQIAADALALPGSDPLATKALTVVQGLLSDLETELVNDSSSVVASAIQDSQGLFANIWSFLNPDDFVGARMTVLTLPDLLPADTDVPFEHELNEGDGSYVLRWTATATRPRIPIGQLPEGERHEIERIATRRSFHYNVDYITHVGGTVNGTDWIVTRGQGVQWIDAGLSFFTATPGGGETDVLVARHDSGTRFLRTEPNFTTDDNLLSLPDLDFYLDE